MWCPVSRPDGGFKSNLYFNLGFTMFLKYWDIFCFGMWGLFLGIRGADREQNIFFSILSI